MNKPEEKDGQHSLKRVVAGKFLSPDTESRRGMKTGLAMFKNDFPVNSGDTTRLKFVNARCKMVI